MPPALCSLILPPCQWDGDLGKCAGCTWYYPARQTKSSSEVYAFSTMLYWTAKRKFLHGRYCRRPTGCALRTIMHTTRHGKKYVWYRLFYADEYRKRRKNVISGHTYINHCGLKIDVLLHIMP